jgi:uncharacterized cofD-like protein
MMTRNPKKRVVVVGGGTGTYTILKGLKRFSDKIDITAIVTMADSGGSTGRLRDEFGQLPVGDVRMALAALSADVDAHDELVRELFLYRFAKGEGLSGHNFGNLLLTALTDILGSEVGAIQAAARILRVRGEVFPVTTDNVHLKAEYDDGEVVVGEHSIDAPPATRAARRIITLSVTPHATIHDDAKRALETADIVVLGPGDLYTGILANAVVAGFSDALSSTNAQIVYVANLMSRTGQTIGMTAQDYVAEIQRYLGRKPDIVIVNTASLPQHLVQRYAAEGNHPVDTTGLEHLCTIVRADILAREPVVTVAGDVLERSLLRHDSDRLAQVVCSLLQ